MSVDRTFYNTLVDDTGSGDGTPIDRSFIDSLIDSIDLVLDTVDDNGALSFAAATELTIASDAVTITAGNNVFSIDTEGNAASDNLATITLDASGRAGRVLVLKAENVARVVTVKDGTGNILLKGGDFVMDDAKHRLMLVRDGSSWYELARTGGSSGGLSASANETITGNWIFSGVLQGNLPQVCNGRLTLTTAVPVTTSDVTGATTIYFTPYHGNRISLYDGTRWKLYTFTERSLALGTLTSGKNYDVFLYDNSGTLTLEFSAAWSSDTARTDALVLQDGVYVKSGATTRRYLGTFRTTSTTQTEDSLAKRFVWNAATQCRVIRDLRATESTDSWTYTTATWRQANAAAANKLELVAGLSVDSVDATVLVSTAHSAGSVFRWVGIGEDSTSSPSPAGLRGFYPAAAQALLSSHLRKIVPLGYHYYAWLEVSEASGTTTWYGDFASSSITVNSGIVGQWRA